MELRGTAPSRFVGNVYPAAELHAMEQRPSDVLTYAVQLRDRAVRDVDDLIDELHRRLR
jgi:hypothetical protein